jgi:hypothetical protein
VLEDFGDEVTRSGKPALVNEDSVVKDLKLSVDMCFTFSLLI